MSGKLYQVRIGREDGDRQTDRQTDESPGKTPTETGGLVTGRREVA